MEKMCELVERGWFGGAGWFGIGKRERTRELAETMTEVVGNGKALRGNFQYFSGGVGEID
jgi:hypothetical protein